MLVMSRKPIGPLPLCDHCSKASSIEALMISGTVAPESSGFSVDSASMRVL